MMSVIAERYSFMSATSAVGAIRSEKEEKSAISEKNTVTLRISPPRAGIFSDASMVSMTCGAR